jgi:hypothetical protein
LIKRAARLEADCLQSKPGKTLGMLRVALRQVNLTQRNPF